MTERFRFQPLPPARHVSAYHLDLLDDMAKQVHGLFVHASYGFRELRGVDQAAHDELAKEIRRAILDLDFRAGTEDFEHIMIS